MKKSIKKSEEIQGIKSEIKIKKSQKLDSANLSKIKEESKGSEEKKGNLYIGFSSLSSNDQKKERSKLRRKLENFRKEILGKDRKKEEKEEGLKSFIQFYKKNWKIQDFKFENFSHQKDEDFKSDWIEILSNAKKSLEK